MNELILKKTNKLFLSSSYLSLRLETVFAKCSAPPSGMSVHYNTNMVRIQN